MEHLLAQDIAMMERALTLATHARIIAPPNPWVGCVIVNDGKIVGEGFTHAPGGPHAEIVALSNAKNHTKGATVYVTLEPCAHFGRTPPCVNALIEAGVSRVVIGVQDPDENVQGKGLARLHEAGIQITKGILFTAISESLASYLHHRKTGLPYCLLKGAISVDGRLAAQDGTSQWISSREALADCHQIRAESQAILVGSGTALADTPTLNVRGVPEQPATPPLRVILDTQGKVPANGPLFDTSIAPTLIITSPNCPEEVRQTWLSRGVQVETVPIAKNGVGLDLHKVLIILGRRRILQLMIEGGGAIFGAFLEARIVDHLSLFIGGCILGNGGIPLFATESITTLKESPQLQLVGSKILGNSVRLDYKIGRNS
ncbi:MAG TPA: bifunctional diaminohydroxyphosphoribosylaminopyrimidine deaminase/5-amino-6-(5-phosphoribosylamino)uracil reductase RibD [Parachlamydiaceae bacterium]|nr:bifunctional diaminohydroxyphosphoribosylaminopyrimidine deaminase/5-amino-6-(5-phosphoribosylamino)uracil reductase RibD [Parachlamydiaceae bacterium]